MKLMKIGVSLVLGLLVLSFEANAAQPVVITPVPPGAPNPWMQHALPAPAMPYLPFGMPMPFQSPRPGMKPYTMRPAVPRQAKMQMMQMMMPVMNNLMRMDMADGMNWMAHKIKAKPGLSFDDVMESMMLRANKLNFKYVGSNLMWKDFRAVLGDMDSPRIEVHSFCDIAVGRDLLKISPEFLVFLPCRIAVMEDADKNVWVMMLDWDMSWVAGYEQSMGITSELARGAIDIRTKMEDIMLAAANGDI